MPVLEHRGPAGASDERGRQTVDGHIHEFVQLLVRRACGIPGLPVAIDASQAGQRCRAKGAGRPGGQPGIGTCRRIEITGPVRAEFQARGRREPLIGVRNGRQRHRTIRQRARGRRVQAAIMIRDDQDHPDRRASVALIRPVEPAVDRGQRPTAGGHHRVGGGVAFSRPPLFLRAAILGEQFHRQPAERRGGRQGDDQKHQHELARRTEPVSNRHGQGARTVSRACTATM